MFKTSFSELVLYFTVFSVIGWTAESLCMSFRAKKPVNRGFMSGPWSPAYGFGAAALLFLAEPLKNYPAVIFILAGAAALITDIIVCKLLETLFKIRWRKRMFLWNGLLFGLAGLVLVYILHPFIARLLIAGSNLQSDLIRGLASQAIALLFFDLVRSLSQVTKLDSCLTALGGLFQGTKEDCHYSENNQIIDIESHTRLIKAFPNMVSKRSERELNYLRQEWKKYLDEKKNRKKHDRPTFPGRLLRIKEGFVNSYKDITVPRLVWVFLVASIIGFIMESLVCFAVFGNVESRQGMLYGPFSQVYGFGAVLLVLFMAPLRQFGDGWVFVGGGLVGGTFEALCSYLQEAVFGSVSWEYSRHVYSFFGGRTSLKYVIFWAVLAVVYMKYIYPRMSSLIDKVPARAKYFYTFTITFVLCFDMAISALAVGRWSKRLEGNPAKGTVEQWLDERYPDEMLEEIYPNMMFTEKSA